MSINPNHLPISPNAISDDRDHFESSRQNSSYSNDRNVTPFGFTAGMSYASASSSAMSAAAAAALWIHAAAGGGSTNTDSVTSTSLPVRRCSTTSLFESPQPSPFSSMISAAAQQAALAAAQAITSPRSPTVSPGVSSSLQAAVLSLALAASSSCSTASNTSGLPINEYQRPPTTHSSVNNFISLSDHHPELLPVHSTLASVFRRRSSTIAPSYFSNATCLSVDVTQGGEQNSMQATDSKIPPSISFLSPRFEAPDSRLVVSQCGTLNEFQESVDNPESSIVSQMMQQSPNLSLGYNFLNNDQTNDPYMLKIDRESSANLPQRYSIESSDAEKNNPLISIRSTNRSYDDPNELQQQFYKPTKFESVTSHAITSVPHPLFYDRNAKPRYFSPTSAGNSSDFVQSNCQPASPLSCSSLSNSTAPQLNISPVNLDARTKVSMLDNVSVATSRSSASCRSLRTGSEIKADEPNRKREQRLMKNREAARECRRKKKEYVKCLEARVNLLESQNQQLAAELQKVKALCFKELCGFGLNNSTAACAAAVLATVTSVSMSYSDATISDTALVNSNADINPKTESQTYDQLKQQSQHLKSDFSDNMSQLGHTRPPRLRRRSVFTANKQSPYTTQPTWQDEYALKISEPSPIIACNSLPFNQLNHSDLLSTRPSISSMNDPKSDLPLGSISRLHPPTTQHIPHSSQLPINSVEPNLLVLEPKVAADCSLNSSIMSENISNPTHPNWRSPQFPNSEMYQHPRYAAKRAYRNVNFHSDNPHFTATSSQPDVNDERKLSKPANNVNTVAEAAVILAAAAAMVAESESSAPESRLTV